ncbi:MAG: ATP-grasp domain-containing protein [Armatimonadetes bacterium]|nr:ATP-grasp domain-containing protein [Armatimonadota bacterium]
MAPTLLLPPRFSDDSNALWRAAIALQWPIERLQGWTVPEELRANQWAIYGESLWANHIAEQLGVHLFEPPLDYLARLPLEQMGRKIEFGTLKAAREMVFPLFVKPAGDKAFEARVYASPDELLAPDFWPEDLPVLTSEVVRWEIEYRCFVLDGKVETASPYWRGEPSTRDESGAYVSPPDELKEAILFANRVLKSKNENGITRARFWMWESSQGAAGPLSKRIRRSAWGFTAATLKKCWK